MKRVAILQSNYIPWKGYFDLLASVDEFIIYDEMQYTRRDWRNRNQIKTPQGQQWLTIPVQVRGRYEQRICDTQIDGNKWVETHWKAITQNYRRAQHFDAVSQWLEPLFRAQASQTHLSLVNVGLIKNIAEYLGITTTIAWSSDYTLQGERTERLASLCQQAGATEYVSGPAAKEYIEESVFSDREITLTWFDYDGYEPYLQLWGEFTHYVSVIDLLFNCGPNAADYLRHTKQ